MFKKILDFVGIPASHQHLDRSAVEQALDPIARSVPEARWIALVTVDGLPCGIVNAFAGIEADRVSAMSAAMLSLGERISYELKNGNLQYNLIAGADGFSFVLVLSGDYILAMGLRRDASIPDLLVKLRGLLLPLLTLCAIDPSIINSLK